MRQTITILLLLIFVNSFSQTQIFKDYNFNNGDYAIYLVYVGEPKLKWERDSIGRLMEFDITSHYYTDDIEVLNQIKKEWVGDTADYMYECWYDYFIYLTENDSTVLEMRINFECEELIAGISYKINPLIVTKFFPQLNRLEKRTFTFKDFQEGREFWSSVEDDNQFVLKDIYKPKWIDYDGKFRFEYTDTLNLGIRRIKELLAKEITDNYKDDKYHLDGSETGYKIRNGKKVHDYDWLRIYCSKSLYEKFDLYKKHEWKEFTDLRFSLYWKPE